MENLSRISVRLEIPSKWMSLLAASMCCFTFPLRLLKTWEEKTPKKGSVCDVTKFNDIIIPGKYTTPSRNQGH